MNGDKIGMEDIGYQDFMEERGRFQDIMGDCNLSTDAVQCALQALAWLYFRLAKTVTRQQMHSALIALESAALEFNMRSEYRRRLEIRSSALCEDEKT